MKIKISCFFTSSVERKFVLSVNHLWVTHVHISHIATCKYTWKGLLVIGLICYLMQPKQSLLLFFLLVLHVSNIITPWL